MDILLEAVQGPGFVRRAAVIFAALLSLIQISPIKVNPWDGVWGWVLEKLTGNLLKEIEAQKAEFRAFWVDFQRESVLRFARECSSDVPHSREEWNHILDVLKRYEDFCEEYKIANGVIEENTRYLRELHAQLLRDRRL